MVENISRERFVDLAQKRVNKTVNDIRLIGNLSNKTNYSYTELWNTMCLGIVRRNHLERCSFCRERWPRKNEGAKVSFEIEGTARY